MTRSSLANCKTFRRSGTMLGMCQIGVLVTVAAAAPNVVTFTISGGKIMPTEACVVKVTMIGAAIEFVGAYHCPVTVRLHLKQAGAPLPTDIDPFGDFTLPVTSNVNPDYAGSTITGPLWYQIPGLNPANLEISLTGRSWWCTAGVGGSNQNADWAALSTKNSVANPIHIKVLRDGDAVPAIPGFQSQLSIRQYLQPYIDVVTGTVRLNMNEAIFIVELGFNPPGMPAFDLQDLVVHVSLGETTQGLAEQFD